jgi:hypothetical protein
MCSYMLESGHDEPLESDTADSVDGTGLRVGILDAGRDIVVAFAARLLIELERLLCAAAEAGSCGLSLLPPYGPGDIERC